MRLEQWSSGGLQQGKVTGVVYVRPEDVISIQTSVYGDATTVRTGISEGSWVVVKGTPDEVHAKLFPEAEFSRVRERASHDVLMWVIEDCKNAHAGVIGSARLALGLET